MALPARTRNQALSADGCTTSYVAGTSYHDDMSKVLWTAGDLNARVVQIGR